MTHQEFLKSMDELLELPPGSLTGSEKLEDLEQWNSMSMIGFIALANSHNGSRLGPRDIARCSTVADLLELAKVDSASS